MRLGVRGAQRLHLWCATQQFHASTPSTHLDVLRSVDGDNLSKLFVHMPYFGLNDSFAMFLNGTYSDYAESVLNEYGEDGVLDDIAACSHYFSNSRVVSGLNVSIVRAHPCDALYVF